jgi:hypothetical protein
MKRVLLVVLALAAIAPGPAAAKPSGADEAITDLAVSFEVVNKNDSAVPCPSDGRRHTVRGHLTGPSSELGGRRDKPRVVTELLTGWDEGEWAWRFRAVPGYDYAMAMARLGFTSLTLDMLGYGSSDHPEGNAVCFGSQADMNHQIVQQLRAGSYHVASPRHAVPFSTVLVSARDVGPLITAIQAYTWRDIDGISSQVLAHQGLQPYILRFQAARTEDCARGGQEWNEPKGTPPHGGNYVFFGPPDEQFRGDLFYEKRADPRVIESVLALRNTNPCGMVTTTFQAGVVNRRRMSEIKVPVLLVFPGPDDPVFTRDGQEQEAANYGSTDITTAWMDSGHFMELEECAPAFRQLTAHWIHQRWWVGQDVPPPAVGPGECVTETNLPLGQGPPTDVERPRLRLAVDPRRVARRTRVRFRLAVTTGATASPVAGATVRIGNRTATTNASGRATIRTRFLRRGLRRARASLRGYRRATTPIRVLGG